MALPMVTLRHILIRSPLAATKDFSYMEHLFEGAKQMGHGQVETFCVKVFPPLQERYIYMYTLSVASDKAN